MFSYISMEIINYSIVFSIYWFIDFLFLWSSNYKS